MCRVKEERASCGEQLNSCICWALQVISIPSYCLVEAAVPPVNQTQPVLMGVRVTGSVGSGKAFNVYNINGELLNSEGEDVTRWLYVFQCLCNRTILFFLINENGFPQ